MTVYIEAAKSDLKEIKDFHSKRLLLPLLIPLSSLVHENHI